MASPQFPDRLKKCSCAVSKNNIFEFTEIKDILPVDYEYTMCEWSKVDEQHFECRFRVNVSTKDGAILWLDEFKVSSNTFYTKDKTFPENTQSNVYKVCLKCHHNTRPKNTVKQPSSRNTGCPARLIITVKQTGLSRKYQSSDVHLQEFPMIVIYRNTHNHSIDSAAALKCHFPNSNVKDKFIKYFEKGLTPSKAVDMYTAELKEIYKDQYYKVLADGSLYPDKKWVYNLYYQVFRKEYGEPTGEKMLYALKSYITNYNNEMNGRFAELKVLDDENFVIVSPLMKRVLENLTETSEVLFADSTGNVDRYGSKLFLFLTNSCCGGLPVGCIITTSEREEILICAFELFKSFLNSSSFGGRGLVGPKVIMTDDSTSDRNSFQKTFPNSTLLLCTFHVLQAAWRYVMNTNNGIPVQRRQELFFKIKDFVNCASENELIKRYTELQDSTISVEFPKFFTYIEKLRMRKKWAKCFRKGLILRGQHTNNICESAFRIVKDSILQRKKAYSATQLFDYIVSDIEQFYEQKLISVSNGRPPAYLKKKVSFEQNKLECLSSVRLTENSYKVINNNTKREYFVDNEIGVCSCPCGESGAICKHQVFVFENNKVKLTPMPCDPTQKALLLFIATGQKVISSNWFAPLCNISNEKNSLHTEEEMHIESDNAVLNIQKGEEKEVIEAPNLHSLCKNSEERQKAMKKELNNCFEIIANKLTSMETLNAVEDFVINFKKLKTENSLNSALKCFGKFSGFSVNRAKKLLATSKKIGVQPTALARRKTLYGGRSTVQSGRPSKKSFTEEHGYSERPKSTLLPRKKSKTAAPHNIGYCVEKNISLGKSH